MGKKKTLKQQDFVKKKLKVGKSQQKPSNLTDTSFVAKTIKLPKTQLYVTNTLNLEKKLSLCKHHNISVRKDTLISLQQEITKFFNTQFISKIIKSIIPMICDHERQVREELMKLFEIIAINDVNLLKLYLKPILLFINNAMTHILLGIQIDSGKFLKIMLKYCKDEVVKQSWLKLLKGLFTILGWKFSSDNNPSIETLSNNINNAIDIDKNLKRKNINLEALIDLIKAGCFNTHEEICLPTDSILYKYIIPKYPHPYQHLNLFSRELKTTDYSEHLSFEDLNVRREILMTQFVPNLIPQLPLMVKQGGEFGKNANNLMTLLTDLEQFRLII